MNPLLPFLIMQGAYYATKHNREESRRDKHPDFDCDDVNTVGTQTVSII